MGKLDGKVALVTGGAQGIGKKICERFASEGASIAVCDYNFEVAEKTAAQLSESVKASAYKMNVSDEASVTDAVAKVIADYEKIDILVNNAGITRDNLVIRMSMEEWNQVITVNLTGTYIVSKTAVKYMMKARTGRIINVSSVVGVMGNPGQVNYAASKAGVIGITKTMAKEFASRNILVNAIAPGYIMTEMTENLSEDAKQAFMTAIPLKRAGLPEDVANVAFFLASGDSSYITGQVIHVDGGMIM